MVSRPVFASLVLPCLSLWRREVVRFVRQRSRVIGALGTPLVFWLLIGSGLRDSFTLGGGARVDYLEYSFPGMVVLILLFTAIFANISVIEDRSAGFLQGVLTAPVDRLAIVLGKISGGTSLAVMQALLFLLLAPLVQFEVSLGRVLAVFGVLVLVAIELSALGFVLAWRLDSVQGFHAIMNLFLMPMWLLSGAFFPAAGASRWMGWVMAINPLTYGVAALRRVMVADNSRLGDLPSLWMSLVVTMLVGIGLTALATRVVRKERSWT